MLQYSTGPNRRGCSGTPLITHNPSQTLSTVDAPLFDLSFAFSDPPSSVVLFYLTLSSICVSALVPFPLKSCGKKLVKLFTFLSAFFVEPYPFVCCSALNHSLLCHLMLSYEIVMVATHCYWMDFCLAFRYMRNFSQGLSTGGSCDWLKNNVIEEVFTYMDMILSIVCVYIRWVCSNWRMEKHWVSYKISADNTVK